MQKRIELTGRRAALKAAIDSRVEAVNAANLKRAAISCAQKMAGEAEKAAKEYSDLEQVMSVAIARQIEAHGENASLEQSTALKKGSE